jgi:hypothetical protein
MALGLSNSLAFVLAPNDGASSVFNAGVVAFVVTVFDF